MKPIVRSLTPADESFLWEMLYQAIYIPSGMEPLARDVIQQPELARYVADWGRQGDCGFIAINPVEDCPIGAVWLRLLVGSNRGYGYIDETTPELSLAVLPEYRGLGIGTRLLRELLRFHNDSPICLSVSRDNPARRLYERLGFEIVREQEGSLTMRWIQP